MATWPFFAGLGLLVAGLLTTWRLVGLGLLVAGLLATGRFVGRRRPARAGPWPGLTGHGAGLLLGCALLLGAGQLLLGSPARPLPDLPPLAMAAVAPLVLASRLARLPGAASAVCGAYLLPRTLVSLVDPGVPPPPLLLVPAVAFDLSAWLRASDLAAFSAAWPAQRRQRAWRRRDRRPRSLGTGRAVLAGAVFGLAWSIVEPPFALLLGAEPATWAGLDVWLAAGVSAVGCAIVALSLASRLSALAASVLDKGW